MTGETDAAPGVPAGAEEATRVREAVEAETRRCVDIVLRLQAHASCRTVKKTCQALVDRILGEPR